MYSSTALELGGDWLQHITLDKQTLVLAGISYPAETSPLPCR